MPIERIPDHDAQGQALLIEQFQGKPRLEAWLRSYLRQVQLLEDATYDVLIKRLLENAVAAQLDAIGRIVGQPRQDQQDDLYRIFIAARIRINRSNGTSKDLLAVLAIINAIPFLFEDAPPATVVVEFLEPTAFDPVLLLGLLRDTKAGGVALSMHVPTTDPDHQFRYSDIDDADVADNGYGDAAVDDVYGLLSDAVTIR
jgi:hypothetical protein